MKLQEEIHKIDRKFLIWIGVVLFIAVIIPLIMWLVL